MQHVRTLDIVDGRVVVGSRGHAALNYNDLLHNVAVPPRALGNPDGGVGLLSIAIIGADADLVGVRVVAKVYAELPQRSILARPFLGVE